MQVSDIFLYVRTSLDSDATELPDTLVGAWLNAAENRIYEAVETSARLWGAAVTVTGDGITQVFSVVDGTGRNVEVRAINFTNGPQYQLEPYPHELALRRWPRNAVSGSPTLFGNTTHWSVPEDASHSVWLWRAPNSGDTFKVIGLSQPTITDFTVTSNTPQLPQRYHSLLAEYCVARGAELQQNLSIASAKMSRFEGELDQLQRKDNRPAKVGVTTIGSAKLRRPMGPIGRLPFSWE